VGRLTDAVGIVSFAQGIANLVGPPLAGDQIRSLLQREIIAPVYIRGGQKTARFQLLDVKLI